MSLRNRVDPSTLSIAGIILLWMFVAFSDNNIAVSFITGLVGLVCVISGIIFAIKDRQKGFVVDTSNDSTMRIQYVLKWPFVLIRNQNLGNKVWFKTVQGIHIVLMIGSYIAGMAVIGTLFSDVVAPGYTSFQLISGSSLYSIPVIDNLALLVAVISLIVVKGIVVLVVRIFSGEHKPRITSGTS